MRILIILGILLSPLLAKASAMLDIRSKTITLNSALDSMYALSPHNDQEFPIIDNLNSWIGKEINKQFNIPEFDVFKYHTLLKSFYIHCSPDSQVWYFGWYLNNGGSWMMQYGGFYFQNKNMHRFMGDFASLSGDSLPAEARHFNPLASTSVEYIVQMPDKNKIYLCKNFLRTCGTCGTLSLSAFTMNDSGFPVAYNAFDTTEVFDTECRLRPENNLDYNEKEQTITLNLLFDDLNELYHWFTIKKGLKEPELNHLFIQYKWINNKFVKSKIKRTKILVANE